MGKPSASGTRLRRIPTLDLTGSEITIIRELLVTAFWADEEERFDDHDWEHALGGVHFVLEVDGAIVGHAAVVERELHVDGHPLRTGYVEAVATAAERQGAGFGSMVMADVTSYIRERFELGALGTGRHHFYERLGWLTRGGPAFVRTAGGPHRPPDEGGLLPALPAPSAPPPDLTPSLRLDRP